jgi:predicted GIY-YIG superfamily endonuclease
MQNRIREHNIGAVRSTKLDLPWNLYAYEIVDDRKEAMRLEWKIKKSRGFQVKWLENNKMATVEISEKDIHDL